MNTKLTLTIEQTLIDKAKQYARRHNRSLSDIIENYIKLLINEEHHQVIDHSPVTSIMKGAFTAPEDLDYKSALSKRLSDKYQ
jgi:hypothetical protein